MLNIAPCKDCTRRSVRCHTSCEDYTAWLKAREEHYKPFRDQCFIVSAYNFSVSEKIQAKEFWAKKVGRG